MSPIRSNSSIITPRPAAPVEDGPDRAAVERVCDDPTKIRAVFQPIVDLTTGEICGYEALARFKRWNPGQWFREAARTGLAGPLEASIIHAVLGGLDKLPDGCVLHINVTPFGVLDPVVQEALTGYGEIGDVVLELSEDMRVVDYGALSEALAPARDLGALIGVDAAGDHSPLSHFLNLEPEILKIGRSVVADCGACKHRAALIEGITVMAERVGAATVAEGIETEEQLAAVIELGVPLGQGFAFGHGLPMMSVHKLGLRDFIRAQAEPGPGAAAA
jgi:EAL domain-containing protein (putative c-di-GMP-specific phosphodiesterase class I)